MNTCLFTFNFDDSLYENIDGECLFTVTHCIALFVGLRGATRVNLNEDNPACKNVVRESSFWQYKVCWIVSRVLWKRCVKEQWVSRE